MKIGGLRDRLEMAQRRSALAGEACHEPRPRRRGPRTGAISCGTPPSARPSSPARRSCSPTGLPNLFVGLKLPLAQQRGSLPQPPSQQEVVSRNTSKSSEQNIGQLRTVALFSYPAPLPLPHPGRPADAPALPLPQQRRRWLRARAAGGTGGSGAADVDRFATAQGRRSALE
jgi:hypothetical protein